MLLMLVFLGSFFIGFWIFILMLKLMNFLFFLCDMGVFWGGVILILLVFL